MQSSLPTPKQQAQIVRETADKFMRVFGKTPLSEWDSTATQIKLDAAVKAASKRVMRRARYQ